MERQDFDSLVSEEDGGFSTPHDSRTNPNTVREVLSYLLTVQLACVVVIMTALISEHYTHLGFRILGFVGVIYYSCIYLGNRYDTSTHSRPYAGFLSVVYVWEVWLTLSCVFGTESETPRYTYTSLFSDSDLCILISCFASEVILLAQHTSVFVLAINWVLIFTVPPPLHYPSEFTPVYLLLVFSLRHISVYQLRRYIANFDHSVELDFDASVSGFWILVNTNYTVHFIGIVIFVGLQLIYVTYNDYPQERKKKI